jgi:menaquinone-dependent protoporphyrinogen IX oxidase
MKGAILYKGKYGATEQYARWLSEELALPFLDIDTVSREMLAQYDFVIAGASVYVGKMQNRKWLLRYCDLLKSKKLFLFVVCATPKTEKEKLNTILNTSIPPVLLDKFDIYFLQGRMIMSKLSWIDRLMLKMGASLEKDPETKKRMLQDFDSVKKENIYSLLDAVNAYRKTPVYATEH